MMAWAINAFTNKLVVDPPAEVPGKRSRISSPPPPSPLELLLGVPRLGGFLRGGPRRVH